jgi:hypothetical protein
MDTELERFKTEIDLREFAGSLGFALDRRRSCRSEAVMKLDARDTLVISRGTDGHYIYFSPKNGHSGTVIDLAKVYVSQNFGEIRKALRRFAGAEIPATLPALQKSSRDFDQVAKDWHAAAEYAGHTWLEGERSIPPALASSARFEGCLKVGGRDNVLFAHRNLEDRLCGFEKKNRGFTGFSGGGKKGLGCSNDFPGDVRIVLAESFIDMLSYAALFPDEQTRYRSFGGGLNPRQPELIRAHILALPRGSEVIAAIDADEAGHGFAETIRSLSDGYPFREHSPYQGDWNDVLRGPSLPTARQVNEP